MSESVENKEQENYTLLKKLSDHPVISIITYSILLAGAVFAFSKFYLIERIELDYQSQLETQKVALEQYKSKLDLVENDNLKLTEERNRYIDYLKTLPNNVYFFEDKIATLEDENKRLKENSEASSNKPIKNYSYEYNDIKKSNTIVDSYTGLIVCITDIQYSNEADMLLTLPGQETKKLTVTAGYVEEFSFNNTQYQFIITKINWSSNTYSFVIIEK